MYQCGIPKDMALELFKPHVMQQLVEKVLHHNIKAAKKIIDEDEEYGMLLKMLLKNIQYY